MTEDNKLRLAATFLDDAISCRHIDFDPSPRGTRIYRIYKLPWLRYLLYVTFLTHISLALFEAPALPGCQWPSWATTTIEFICIMLYMGRLFHEMLVCVDAKTFWKDTKHIINAAILVLTVIDICVFVGMSQFNTALPPLRFSRPLRPFLLVNFTEARQVRRAFRTIRRSLPDLGNALILFMASLSLFSLMAVKLFERRALSGDHYFSNFFDAFWNLYVLVTTANSPDVMMPAYKANRAYIFFFVAFLLVNLYLFMRVFLAVIYKSYKDNLRSEVQEAIGLKRQLLQHSHQLLANAQNGGMSKDTFKALMKQVLPAKNEEYWEVAWMVLADDRSTTTLSLGQFNHICEFIDVSVVDIRHKESACFVPSHIYLHWRPSQILIKCVRHIYFRYLFDAIIFLNAIFIAFDIEGGEPVFLALFTLEIVLKLYAFGFKAFLGKLWNIFDLVVVSSAIVASITEAAMGESRSSSDVAIDFLMVLRVIRIFKIFHSVGRFRVVINTILHILPSMATYIGVLMIFFYFFAIIGMELFGGKINEGQANCGNPALQDSEFNRDGYCPNNFNDLFSAWVTLFELLTVNQWHIITEGFVLVTGKAARVYFFFFHLICVTVILNIFSAFVIEAFILEFNVTSDIGTELSPLMNRIASMGLAYDKASQALEIPLKNDENMLVLDADHNNISSSVVIKEEDDVSQSTCLRFRLKSRTRTVMGLLEKMFESDIVVK